MAFVRQVVCSMTLMIALFFGMESQAGKVMDIRVDHVQWRSDREFGRYTNWKEIAIEAASGNRFYQQGSANFFLYNTGDQPKRIVDFMINGKPASEWRSEHKVIWYRCLPNPIPAGGYGKVTVCFRTVPVEPVEVKMIVDDGQKITCRIDPKPVDFRINGIGFPPGGKQCAIYLRRYEKKTGDELVKVSINGKTLSASEIDWLSQRFVDNVAGCILEPTDGFKIDDYIYIKTETSDGRVAADLVRVLDGFVPFGTYGAVKLAEHSAVGMNSYISFGWVNKNIADSAQAIGMRVIPSIHSLNNEMCGHPGIFSYSLGDEPDVSDYNVKDVPMHLRIGYHAQGLAEMIEALYLKDPLTPTSINLDLTFKPYNWYTYAQLSDYAAMDCYPLIVGEPLNWIVQCFGSLVDAADPKPSIFVFSNTWEEKEGRGINRRPTWHEVRRSMLYGLGCGARGLLSFIDVNEKGSIIFHAASSFPDSYAAQNELYRALRPFSDLIAVNQSLEVGSCSTPKVWVRTLLCGKDGVMCVVVNEDGESTHDRSTLRSKKNVRITLPSFPWINIKRAVRLLDGKVEDVAFAAKDRTITITLDQLKAGDVILMTADPKLPEIMLAKEREEQMRLAYARTLQQWKADHETGQQTAFVYDLQLNRADQAITGTGIGGQITGYGVSKDQLWNPTKTKLNTWEWYRPRINNVDEVKDGVLSQFEWQFTIARDQADQALQFCYQCRWFGAPVRVSLCDADGRILAEQTPNQGLNRWLLPKLKAGKYTVHLTQQSTAVDSGTSIANAAFLLPIE